MPGPVQTNPGTGMEMAPGETELLPTPVGPVPTPGMGQDMHAMKIPTAPNVCCYCLPRGKMGNIDPVTISHTVGPGMLSGTVVSPGMNIMGSTVDFTQVMPSNKTCDAGLADVTNMVSISGVPDAPCKVLDLR